MSLMIIPTIIFECPLRCRVISLIPVDCRVACFFYSLQLIIKQKICFINSSIYLFTEFFSIIEPGNNIPKKYKKYKPEIPMPLSPVTFAYFIMLPLVL